MDHDPSKKTDPPETDAEWEYIWDAVAKARASWIIVGPVHAIVTNWKALLIAAAVVVWINKPEIIQALTVLAGGGK